MIGGSISRSSRSKRISSVPELQEWTLIVKNNYTSFGPRVDNYTAFYRSDFEVALREDPPTAEEQEENGLFTELPWLELVAHAEAFLRSKQ